MGVMFGSTPAQSYTVNSASAITAVAPSHVAGQVDIIVDTMSGNSSANASDKFNFTQAAPTVTQVGPTSGGTAGGTAITVTGTNFTGASSVLFGTTIASSFTVTSSTSLMVTAPSHSAGMVDVTVVTSAGSSAVNPNDQYNYTSSGPTVTSISPGTGTGSGRNVHHHQRVRLFERHRCKFRKYRRHKLFRRIELADHGHFPQP